MNEADFQRPRVEEYPFPPKCGCVECINFAGRSRPLETYWLCSDCTENAPPAWELGYARKPKDYYTNVKPWGPAKRAQWVRTTNASVLLAMLTDQK